MVALQEAPSSEADALHWGPSAGGTCGGGYAYYLSIFFRQLGGGGGGGIKIARREIKKPATPCFPHPLNIYPSPFLYFCVHVWHG